MPSLLMLLLTQPIRAILFLYVFSVKLVLIAGSVIFLTAEPRYQSLRIQIQRAYLSSAALHFPDMPHRLPANYPEEDALPVNGHSWKGYIVPGQDESALENASYQENWRVVLFAHGGGYARGTARMHVPYMQRWVARAKDRGFSLVFLTLEYTLSIDAPHPKQRGEFLAAYYHLLGLGIPSRRIFFMGDSAGGGICVNSALQAQKEGLPQPGGSILISPWLDVAMSTFEGGSHAVTSDYFVHANSAVPVLANLFRGLYDSTDSEVNPLYCDKAEIEGLNPQLIFVGAAEFALHDSKQWREQCHKANVEYEIHIEWGQLHVWALGSKWVSRPYAAKRTRGYLTGYRNLDVCQWLLALVRAQLVFLFRHLRVLPFPGGEVAVLDGK